MKTTNNTSSTASPDAFPCPFTLEQLREDILDVYLLQLRTTTLFAEESKIWELAGHVAQPDGSLWRLESSPKDLGLAYSDIQDSTFARVLEQQFSFAFTGQDNLLCEPMDLASTHTWVAAYLMDLKDSSTASEWQNHGAGPNSARLLHTCELANARNILEGEESFSPEMSSKGEDSGLAEGFLTVRQMALLAAMEEMSVRTAISRKSVNQLQAIKDDRRTLIRISDAKEWLLAKGRYVPVTRFAKAGADMRLETTSFKTIDIFSHAINQRLAYIHQMQPDANTHQQLFDAATKHGAKNGCLGSKEDLLNHKLMSKVANILQLPVQLLILRAKQTALLEELLQTSDEVNRISTPLRTA